MSNDLVKFNKLVGDMERTAAELADLGREGFKVPFVTTPDELAELLGAAVGSWRPLSNDLIWFCAVKTLIHSHQILAEAGRIFAQMDDEASAQKIQTILQTVERQFHPCETTLQVYGKLLGQPPQNGQTWGGPP